MLYTPVVGAPPIYPNIQGGRCCEGLQHTGCTWNRRVPGICANYEQYQVYLQRTETCKEVASATYEWIYRAVMVPITQNCYCRYDKVSLKKTSILNFEKCLKLKAVEPDLNAVLGDAMGGQMEIHELPTLSDLNLTTAIENPAPLDCQINLKAKSCTGSQTEITKCPM